MKETKIIVEMVNNKPNYDKVKHLEFIENIIKRMADNSLSMKKFCLTIFVALMAVNINNDSVSMDAQRRISCLLILNTIIFASLDAYYLYLERLYRDLYINVAEGHYQNYELKIEKSLIKSFEAYKSCSIWGFYLMIIIFILFLNNNIVASWFV